MGFSYLGTTMTWHSCPCGKTPPKPPLQLVINLNSLSQLIQTGFGFLFQLFFPQFNSENYLEPERFSKQVPYCIWVLTSNQFSWIVLWTHNPEPSWSTPPLFKFFKIQSLQVWTRFAKFGEIHIHTAPKIPPKIMQPTWARRSHSTKNQLKEKSPEANFIRSNTLWALLRFKVQKIQFQCHLQSVSFSHAATVPLARSSPPLPLVRSCTRVRGAFLASVARWLALAGVFCGVGTRALS